jgi:hypothetical protein
MWRKDHVGIVVLRAFDGWWDLQNRRLEEHERIWKYRFDHVLVFPVVRHVVVVGEVFVVDGGAVLGVHSKVVLLQDSVVGWVPHAMLRPYTLAELPTRIALPAVFRVVVVFG